MPTQKSTTCPILIGRASQLESLTTLIHQSQGRKELVALISGELLFILLSLIQSIAFGLGIAFLLFGFPRASARPTINLGLARVTQLAIAWSLISWWPHSNFHQILGTDNLSGLLAIEYGFHVTLILAGLIVAYFSSQ